MQERPEVRQLAFRRPELSVSTARIRPSTLRPAAPRIASSDDQPGDKTMRTAVNLDERLLAEAQRLTGIQERTALVNAGLKALVEREHARRLAQLGGSEPALSPIPRQRKALERLRGELQWAFGQPDSSYLRLTAKEVIARNGETR